MADRFNPPLGACFRCERTRHLFSIATTPAGHPVQLCADCIAHLARVLREGRPARSPEAKP